VCQQGAAGVAGCAAMTATQTQRRRIAIKMSIETPPGPRGESREKGQKVTGENCCTVDQGPSLLSIQ